MIRVEIRNFQSIEHTVINMKGFTALVGRSNIGKSAVVRAVEAALTGASGTSFVRHGPTCARRIKGKTCKCFASVHLIGDGFDLLWEKGDGVNRYQYNGVGYDAIARGFPDFLKPDFTPVKVGDAQTVLQVAPQWDSIFLLNATGGNVADVLSDIAQLDRINVAVRHVEKDRKGAAATVKVRREDAERLKTSLHSYSGLDGTLAQTSAVAESLRQVEKLGKRSAALTKYKQSQDVLEAGVSLLAGVSAVQPPDLNPVVGQARSRIRLNNLQAGYVAKTLQVEALLPVEQLSLPVATKIDEARKQSAKFSQWYSKTQTLKAALLRWVEVKDIPIPSAETLPRLVSAVQTASSLLKRFQAVQTALKASEEAFQKALADEQALQEEVHQLGVCPTCSRSFEIGCLA